MPKNNWIYSAWVDGVFILSPPFISLFIVLLFPAFFGNHHDMPLIAWVIIVMFIDVAHVYSSLYRTYFDKETFVAHKSRLVSIPVIAFCVAVLAYTGGHLLFWRLMAYLAVFHFIRQQYGFMRIYGRAETNLLYRKIDTVTIYACTLFPVLHWHLTGPHLFHWFLENDFIYFRSATVLRIVTYSYILLMLIFLLKEGYLMYIGKFTLPKFLVISGTAVSWYFGIVYFNGDMVFTLLNVVAHGVPYITLVWVWGRKKNEKKGFERNAFLRFVFSGKGFVLFMGILFLLAYVEEGLWDMWVWKKHQELFGWFATLQVDFDHLAMTLIVPLLSLPQIVHYIIDGYIWKLKKEESNWLNIMGK